MTAYESMSPHSKVWIYQSNTAFTEEEVPEINTQIQNFVTNWVSHNNALKAFGKLYHQRFIVLMVDETQAGASGCSIDKSVHFIKAMAGLHGMEFFDRMNFAFQKDGKLQTAHRDQFAQLFQNGEINNATLVYNNLVKTKAEFDEKWLVPLESSWHARMV